MKKILLTVLVLTGWMSFGQDCSYGTVSENTSNGGNISTGGTYQYSAASDFDVPFATLFTVNQIQFNVLKGDEDLSYVDVYFLEDLQGKPGDAFQTFENLTPVSQELAYISAIEGMDAYEITVDIPTSFELPKGKYYLQLRAAPSDGIAVSWEITNQETTSLGRFDFSNFENDPWFGGHSYYDYVFQVLGTCADTGEEQPDYGDACAQGNEQNNHETGLNLRGGGLTDDFVVAENTTFTMTDFKISTLQLGNVVNASIKIRDAVNGAPGEVIHSVLNKAPKTENFFGYWPFSGFPLEVVAVDLEFEFDTPIQLSAGTYFIEVNDVIAVQYTDFLAWEATTLPGIGGNAFESFDDGENWSEVPGLNLVFNMSGFCQQTLGVDEQANATVSVYPNPVKGELTISTQAAIKNISMYTMLGQSVMNSKPMSNTIDMSSLTDGMYLVTVALENGQQQTFKIVKH